MATKKKPPRRSAESDLDRQQAVQMPAKVSRRRKTTEASSDAPDAANAAVAQSGALPYDGQVRDPVRASDPDGVLCGETTGLFVKQEPSPRSYRSCSDFDHSGNSVLDGDQVAKTRRREGAKDSPSLSEKVCADNKLSDTAGSSSRKRRGKKGREGVVFPASGATESVAVCFGDETQIASFAQAGSVSKTKHGSALLNRVESCGQGKPNSPAHVSKSIIKEGEVQSANSSNVVIPSCGHHLHPCVLTGGKTCCEERQASKKRGEIRRFLESHGPQWFDQLRGDPIRLRSIGFTEDDVSPHAIRQIAAELAQEREGIETTWAANNKHPDRKLNIVVPGHPELDPDKNAEHPVKGEAHLEKVLKDKKKAETMERISKLRARKQPASDYNDPTPESTFSNEESETMASATMIVKEPAARKLLAAVGIASDDAPLKKVQARVEGLADMAKEPDFKAPEDAVSKKLLKSVLKQLEGGKKVEVGEAAAKVGSNGHAGKNGKAPKAKAPAKTNPSGRGRKAEVKPGTITREYKGKDISVKAKADGTFEFGGKEYSSLTQVAKKVTGADSINGPKFFGITK